MMATILIPTYNRSKFSELVSYNINIQDSIYIKEVLVFDDGDEPLELDVRYPVKYHKLKKRMTIGEKRNRMIKMCKTKYAIFMDDDDIYYPTYVSHSLSLMSKKKPIVGSADMLFYFVKDNVYGSMNCNKTHLIHEATMCVDVSWFSKNQLFKKSNSGEGQGLKGYDKFIQESDIYSCMVCVAHPSNTVSKDVWKKETLDERIRVLVEPKIENHLKILNRINI
jgi:glycosyltransferase involved in cell wall biosynthesis